MSLLLSTKILGGAAGPTYLLNYDDGTFSRTSEASIGGGQFAYADNADADRDDDDPLPFALRHAVGGYVMHEDAESTVSSDLALRDNI